MSHHQMAGWRMRNTAHENCPLWIEAP